jgi:hypothetical protein
MGANAVNWFRGSAIDDKSRRGKGSNEYDDVIAVLCSTWKGVIYGLSAPINMPIVIYEYMNHTSANMRHFAPMNGVHAKYLFEFKIKVK